MRSNRKIIHVLIISAFIIIYVISNSYSPGSKFIKYHDPTSTNSDEEKIAGIVSYDVLIYGISEEFKMVQTIIDCVYLDIDGDYYVLSFVVLSMFFLSCVLTEKINNILNNTLNKDNPKKEKILVCIEMYCIENIVLYITFTVAYPVGDFIREIIYDITNDDVGFFVFGLFTVATLWLMIILFLFIFVPYLYLGGLPLYVLNIFDNVFGACIVVLLEIVTIGFIWHKISRQLINKSLSCIFCPIHLIGWIFRKINSIWKWW